MLHNNARQKERQVEWKIRKPLKAVPSSHPNPAAPGETTMMDVAVNHLAFMSLAAVTQVKE